MQEHPPVSTMYSRPDEFLRSWARFTRGESVGYPIARPPPLSETLAEATHALPGIFGMDETDLDTFARRVDNGEVSPLTEDGFVRASEWIEQFFAAHASPEQVNWVLLNWIFAPGDVRFLVARVFYRDLRDYVCAIDASNRYYDNHIAPLRGRIINMHVAASVKFIDYASVTGTPLAPWWGDTTLGRFTLMDRDALAEAPNAFSCGINVSHLNVFHTAYRLGYVYDVNDELRQTVEEIWGHEPFPFAAAVAVYTARRVLGADLTGAYGPLAQIIRRGRELGYDAVQ